MGCRWRLGHEAFFCTGHCWALLMVEQTKSLMTKVFVQRFVHVSNNYLSRCSSSSETSLWPCLESGFRNLELHTLGTSLGLL